MNAYLRNGIICLIVNVVIFIIGWGCIVPDTVMDNTHLFGLFGDIEITKGNTTAVFGMCSIMSTLSLIAGLVEALVEDYSRPRFNMNTRVEKPRKPLPTGTFAGNKMRIADPASPEKDEDPKTPTLS